MFGCFYHQRLRIIGEKRPGKLNSLFISSQHFLFCMQAGGHYSDFRLYRKPQTTNYKKTTDHKAVPEQAGSFP